MPSRDHASHRHHAPGLTPWQWWLAAYVAGLLASSHPLAAVVGLGLLAVPAWPGLYARGPRLAFALCLVLGWVWGAATAPGPAPDMPGWMAERRVVDVTGRIERVDTRPEQRFRMVLADVRVDGGPLPDRLVFTWYHPGPDAGLNGGRTPAPGQSVSFRGRVKPVRGFINFDSWASRDWWARQGVRWRAWAEGPDGAALSGEPSWPWRLRGALRRAVVRGAPEGPGRAVLLAELLGDRSQLDQDTVDLFRRAGLAHSLALSGLHLGMVASLGLVLAWLIGRARPGVYLRLPRARLAVLLAAPLAAAYVWLGGATPSLVRAAIMFAAFGWLLLRGRERVLVDGLFAALAVILLVSPQSVHDIRLQFSALAVGGMAWALPPAWGWLGRVLPGSGWRRPVRALLLVLLTTAVANLALLPLTAQSFGRLPVNVLANAFWLPLLALAVMPLGLAGMALSALGLTAVGHGALWLGASLVDAAVHWLAVLDAAGGLPEVVVLRPGWAGLLGYYALAVGALSMGTLWAGAQKGDTALRRRAAVLAMAGLVLLAAPQVVRAVDQARDRVRLTVLDTGQSQAVLIEGPGGARALLDGGGGWSDEFDMGRAVTTPVITAGRPPRLALAAMSHPDLDHAQGLVDMAAHFTLGGFVYNGQWPDSGLSSALPGLLAARAVPVAAMTAGDRVVLAPGLELRALHPPRGYRPESDNDDSLVLRLSWRGKGLALVPGDVEQGGLDVMLRVAKGLGMDLRADALVLPHHGSRSSLSPELYDAVRPVLAVAAAGFLNPFHHPHPSVVRALAERGVPVLSTGNVGAVQLTWDAPDQPPTVRTADGSQE